ncbi:MAG TPA: hypothetical protein VGR91_10720, partial [Stellaceae bacterium]|nr:hypothetical protein [Stellaceae bacterium]
AAKLALGTFTGITDGVDAQTDGYELEPPDQGLAVGQGVIFEINNNTLQLFRTNGRPLTLPVFTATFFNVNPDFNQVILSDPHVLYDPSSRRWFVDELVYSLDGSFSGFAIAVSQTSDPAGAYNLYQARAFSDDLGGCGSTDCLADFPQVGYDANAYFIASDLFDFTSSNFVATGLYVFPKLRLERGASIRYLRFTSDDFVMQPSVPALGEPFATADNGTEYLMTARNIVDGSNRIRVVAIVNTAEIAAAPRRLRGFFTEIRGQPYGQPVPQTEPDVVGPYCQSQGVTSAPLLDGGYGAFGSNIVLAGGKLFGALTSGAVIALNQIGNVIAYFVVAPTLAAKAVTAAIVKQGYLVPPRGFSLSYPALALQASGRGVLGMSITGSKAAAVGGFPSAAVTRFRRSTPSPDIVVSGQGDTSDDGFSGCQTAGPGGIGRWGDYGAATVDPATGFFYTANEYIPEAAKYPRGPAANWGTLVTRTQ